MPKARWIELENVLVVDFRPKYRGLELPIPPRAVYRRRSRRNLIRGAVFSPQVIGRVRAVQARYQKQGFRPYMSCFVVLPLPDSGPTCPEPFCSVCE